MRKYPLFVALLANYPMIVCGCGGAPSTTIYETIVEVADAGPPKIIVENSDAGVTTAMPKIVGRQSQPNTMTTGNTQPVNGLQVGLVDPEGDPESGTMTLAFSVQPPTVPSSNGLFDCQAIINWTIDGNRVQRRISIGNGTSITGVGDSVTVQLVDHTTARTGNSLGNAYGVDVQVGLGPRGSVAQLPTLIELANAFTLAPSGIQNIRIPQDAGIIAVKTLVRSEQVPPGPANVTVNFVVGFGASTGSFDPQVQEDFVPVPPSTIIVQVVNNDVANSVAVAIQWGIDG